MQSLLQIPFAITVSLIAILASFIKDYQSDADSSHLLLGGLFAIVLLALVLVLYRFKNCFYGHEYWTLPTLDKIKEHRTVLMEYHLNNKCDEDTCTPEDKTNLSVTEQIDEYYIRCASYNAKVNSYRGDQWTALNQNLAVLAILVAVTYVYFYAGNFDIATNKKEQTAKSLVSEHSDARSSIILSETYFISTEPMKENRCEQARPPATTSHPRNQREWESSTSTAATRACTKK
ncbi:hypothetical protein A5320_07225 [Rheinheimera sp. SA_1]|uniref:hypothetical protein n=1 Tax=Rheinheimera sp. SA_1 TaxID=1827365 RepID=UPI0007FC0962|nr:hypothetical protein [Rheinheimera sp. SA_1]OBP15168.1 hypothetical protein A5320_07225 [Rheinheimera sp. SA_1]